MQARSRTRLALSLVLAWAITSPVYAQKLERPVPPPPAPDPPPILFEEPDLSDDFSVTARDVAHPLTSFGLIDVKATGLPEYYWARTTLSDASRLLRGLPEASLPSDMLRRHLITALMMQAPAPRNASLNWHCERWDALMTLDARAQAVSLHQSIPASDRASLCPSVQMELLVTSGRSLEACAFLAASQTAKALSEENAEKLDLTCLALNGQFAESELAFALAEERGAPFDAWFVSLIEHVQYQTPIQSGIDEERSAFDRMLLQLVQSPPEAEHPPMPEAKLGLLAQAPAQIYALWSQGKLDEADDWLMLMDRHQPEEVGTYLMHELVRFLRSDLSVARSAAATSLPPFTGVKHASPAQAALLYEFYQLMESFDYEAPPITVEWASQHAVNLPRRSVSWPEELRGAVQKLAPASYALHLAANYPAASELDAPSLQALVFDLKQLAMTSLARQLAAEYLMQSLVRLSAS